MERCNWTVPTHLARKLKKKQPKTNNIISFLAKEDIKSLEATKPLVKPFMQIIAAFHQAVLQPTWLIRKLPISFVCTMYQSYWATPAVILFWPERNWAVIRILKFTTETNVLIISSWPPVLTPQVRSKVSSQLYLFIGLYKLSSKL